MKLYHPALDRTIDVSEKLARTYRRSGWIDPPTEDVPSEAPDVGGLADGPVGGPPPEHTPDETNKEQPTWPA